MSSLKGKRISLIGGAGFIGHNLAVRLMELGAEVSIMDNLQVNNLLAFIDFNGASENRRMYLNILNERLDLLRQSKVSLMVRDARDYNLMRRYLDDFQPDAIIHLAAVAHANKSNKDPFSTFDHSFRTLENALDCARHRVEHFIYFSSSMVYGHFPNGFVTEETPCEPLGIYAALKFGGEKLVIAYNQVFDLPYTIIRPSALYGPRCVSRRVAQIFIENAIQGREVTIHGDGSDKLDFTYIDDFVQGIVKTLGSPKSIKQTFNLTYGKSRTLADLLAIIQKHYPNVRVLYKAKDKVTPDRGTLSVDKARELIGYEPEWDLDRGIEKYIGWYKTFLQGRQC